MNNLQAIIQFLYISYNPSLYFIYPYINYDTRIKKSQKENASINGNNNNKKERCIFKTLFTPSPPRGAAIAHSRRSGISPSNLISGRARRRREEVKLIS